MLAWTADAETAAFYRRYQYVTVNSRVVIYLSFFHATPSVT